MLTDDEDLLWAEDVAKLANCKPVTIRVKASVSRRKAAAGPLHVSDLPLPVGSAPRTIGTRGGGTRVVSSPRWRRADIEAWLPNRIPRGRPGHRAVR